MNKFSFDDNIICINNIKIATKYPIKSVERVNDKYVILLEIPCVELGIDELNNILCYDEKGKMCWQISNKLPPSITCKDQMPYVAIRIIDRELYATDFWGRRFRVDVNNGALEDVKMMH